MAEAKAGQDKSVDAVRAANAEAQKRANEAMLKEDTEKAMDAEEAASRAQAKTATNVVPGPTVQPPKLLSRTGGAPISRSEEAHTSWAIGFGNCPDAETALNSPALLWQIQGKIKRFDTILMHDEFFAWEVFARVMKIDKDLQVVLVSPIGGVTKHSISNKPIEYGQIKIVNRGAVGKWSWVMEPDTARARVLKDGFETEELAQYELKKKLAA